MLTISRFSDSARCAPLWLLLILIMAISLVETGLASLQARDTDEATLLALGKYASSDDQTESPQNDAILLLNSKGQVVRQIPRPAIGYHFGGECRGISVSQDGRFFVVCGHSGQGISMYRTDYGIERWSLSGVFRSAVFADTLIYAVGRDGIYAIDREGTIIKHSRIGGGIDIAFDPLSRCLWVVGFKIRKYTLDLRLLFKVKLPFSIRHGGAFSVDVNPDGSVWVAGRNVYEREGDANQLVKISPAGEILNVIDLDFCPQRVRVDRSDGSVWTTGSVRRKDYSRIGDEWPETVDELDKLVDAGVQTYTRKYDPQGNLLVNSTLGGTSIEVDPSDGSVWIAGDKSILRCSAMGENLATYTGSSGNRKWLAIVP